MKISLPRSKSRVVFCALAVGATMTVHAAAPVIKSLVLAGATPQLSIQSDVGSTNQIQSKTNLTQANWSVVTNLVVPQSPYTFVDNGTPASSRRR